MPKFKCCRQTFLNRITLDEHVSTHPPNWGKKNQVNSVLNRATYVAPTVLPVTEVLPEQTVPAIPPAPLSPPLLLTPPLTPCPSPTSQSPSHQPEVQVDPPVKKSSKKDTSKRKKRQRVNSIKDVEVVQPVEPEEELHPNRECWKEWDCALGTLLEERNRLTNSHADAFYWDLALETLISLRNKYYRQKLKDTGSGGVYIPAPRSRSIVAVEEHNEVVQRIGEVARERDALRTKCEESETRRRVLEQIEKQYKAMLSLRTEEVYKVKKFMSERSQNNGFTKLPEGAMLPPPALI